MRDYELSVVLARNRGQFAASTNHGRITGKCPKLRDFAKPLREHFAFSAEESEI